MPPQLVFIMLVTKVEYCVCDRVRQRRLRRFRHVERKDEGDWFSASRHMSVATVAEERGRGRGGKTWKEWLADDTRDMNLRKEDRGLWRSGISGNRPGRARAETRTIKRWWYSKLLNNNNLCMSHIVSSVIWVWHCTMTAESHVVFASQNRDNYKFTTIK